MADQEQPGWVEKNVIAFALGTLSETEEQRFRQAIQEDAEFADLLEIEDVASIGHVPAALIARWDAAGRVLDRTERELVVDHARGCPSCCEELELLGYAVPEVTDPARPVGFASWRGWLGGIVLGAAAMLAFVMFTSPQLLGRQTPTSSASSPSVSDLQGKVIQVVTPRAMRGAESAIVRLSADANAFLLAVSLPTDVAAGAEAKVAVIDPAGQVLSESKLDPAPWPPPSTQILVLGDPYIAAGEYRVELRVRGESTARFLGRFSIELKR